MISTKVIFVTGATLGAVSIATVAGTTDWSAEVPVGWLLFMSLWPTMPLVVGTVAGWLLSRSRAALWLCWSGQLAAFITMAVLYGSVFVLHPDPQGGLIIVFGPIYALGVTIPILVAAVLARVRMGGALVVDNP